MNTTEICQTIKQDIPETRNQPQLMNSFMVLLNELNRVVVRINELGSENKIVLDIKIEKK